MAQVFRSPTYGPNRPPPPREPLTSVQNCWVNRIPIYTQTATKTPIAQYDWRNPPLIPQVNPSFVQSTNVKLLNIPLPQGKTAPGLVPPPIPLVNPSFVQSSPFWLFTATVAAMPMRTVDWSSPRPATPPNTSYVQSSAVGVFSVMPPRTYDWSTPKFQVQPNQSYVDPSEFWIFTANTAMPMRQADWPPPPKPPLSVNPSFVQSTNVKLLNAPMPMRTLEWRIPPVTFYNCSFVWGSVFPKYNPTPPTTPATSTGITWNAEPVLSATWNAEPTAAPTWNAEPTTTSTWNGEAMTTTTWNLEPTTGKTWQPS